MIRFGILGTARIARAFLGYPLEGAEVVAIASRELARAHKFADEFRIPLRFGSYDDLLSEPGIDAVYIPLPQHLHCTSAVKSARAGKHVLVEKPAALTAAEFRIMHSACQENSVLLMEAFMYRFMRVHRRAKELATDGTIGNLRYIDFNFAFDIVARARTGFRLAKESGGGALYDLGIYGLDFIRFITGREPVLIQSFMHRPGDAGVDEFTHALYRIGDVVATLTCAFNTDANYYVLSGDKGSVAAPVAISGRALPNTLNIHLLDGDKKYAEHFPPENPYKAEIEYFSRCIEETREPFLTSQNSLRNLELLDQLLNDSTQI